MKTAMILALTLLAASACSEERAPAVVITQPKDGDRVPEISVVKITAPSTAKNVWVIVHPLDQRDAYYVQKPADNEGGGKWRCEAVHVGRTGAVDIGKDFSIVAVLNPKAELKHNQVLTGWPPAEARSEIVDVVRK